jgi:hypothetical protein
VNINFTNIFDASKIEEIFSVYSNNVNEFHDPVFQAKVVEVFKVELPEIYALTQEVRRMVLTEPYFVVVKGLNFNHLKEGARDVFILAFNSSLGYSTPTDQVNKKVLWPVKAETSPALKNLTFSQRLGEAEYHTDTQYFKEPEKIFSLWCVTPDKNKGGVNGLVRADYIVREIMKREDGKEVIEALTKTDFPFRVPSVFTASGKDDVVEYFLGPILSKNPKIRYRKDTIDEGTVVSGIKLSSIQTKAIDVIESILNSQKEEFTNFLEREEVIFVNNHELLHNRSDYQDLARFLIRVRIKV